MFPRNWNSLLLRTDTALMKQKDANSDSDLTSNYQYKYDDHQHRNLDVLYESSEHERDSFAS